MLFIYRVSQTPPPHITFEENKYITELWDMFIRPKVVIFDTSENSYFPQKSEFGGNSKILKVNLYQVILFFKVLIKNTIYRSLTQLYIQNGDHFKFPKSRGLGEEGNLNFQALTSYSRYWRDRGWQLRFLSYPP